MVLDKIRNVASIYAFINDNCHLNILDINPHAKLTDEYFHSKQVTLIQNDSRLIP